ncbi:TPA: terminase family protein [Escherichia coli]
MTISTDLSLLHDPRRQARLLFWQGFSVPQIADTLQVKRPTVQSWKQRDGWEETAPLNRVETTLEARLIQLYAKPDLTPHDFKVADFLSRQMERFARINRYGQTGNEVDLNPNIASRNKGDRKKPKRNYFSDEAIEKLEEIFFDQSFEYQLNWHKAGIAHRIRHILKSRQIGATFYFARESLLRALKTGQNQIFLSASKTQAYVFRKYIIAFARMVDVDLSGDPIVIGNNGAELIFLGTNSNTAQSHNGDLYVDEIFWIPNFQKLRKVASGMASQSHLRTTYFSTPSTLAHGAYIMYVTDAAQSSTDVESLRNAMRDSKGLGNFKNLFFYAPNGKPDGIKIVPLSEVATKDDFFNIKKVSAEDLLSAHRVPPQMMGIMPNNVGGFGDVVKAAQVFVRNELTPLQERFKELNNWLEMEVIRFKKYSL